MNVAAGGGGGHGGGGGGGDGGGDEWSVLLVCWCLLAVGAGTGPGRASSARATSDLGPRGLGARVIRGAHFSEARASSARTASVCRSKQRAT